MNVEAVFPYLCVSDASAASVFYQQAFHAAELFRLVEPSGRVGHMELKIGQTTVMFCEAFPEFGIACPPPSGARSHQLHLHVDDADAVIAQALKAGATLEQPAQNQFFGERSGSVLDPFGHRWLIGHEIETISPEEMQRRYTELFSPSR